VTREKERETVSERERGTRSWGDRRDGGGDGRRRRRRRPAGERNGSPARRQGKKVAKQ